MKKTFLTLASLVTLFSLAAITQTFAADKEITITGEGKCAKCAMKETDSCQNAIEVEKNGTKKVYYLAKNDVSKDFHSKVCKGPHKVTATGTVKKEDGKMILTVTKIDLAE